MLSFFLLWFSLFCFYSMINQIVHLSFALVFPHFISCEYLFVYIVHNIISPFTNDQIFCKIIQNSKSKSDMDWPKIRSAMMRRGNEKKKLLQQESNKCYIFEYSNRIIPMRSIDSLRSFVNITIIFYALISRIFPRFYFHSCSLIWMKRRKKQQEQSRRHYGTFFE